MMYGKILCQRQRQEEIGIIRNFFNPHKRCVHSLNTVRIGLHAFKTPVCHRTELPFLIDDFSDRVGKIG